MPRVKKYPAASWTRINGRLERTPYARPVARIPANTEFFLDALRPSVAAQRFHQLMHIVPNHGRALPNAPPPDIGLDLVQLNDREQIPRKFEYATAPFYPFHRKSSRQWKRPYQPRDFFPEDDVEASFQPATLIPGDRRLTALQEPGRPSNLRVIESYIFHINPFTHDYYEDYDIDVSRRKLEDYHKQLLVKGLWQFFPLEIVNIIVGYCMDDSYLGSFHVNRDFPMDLRFDEDPLRNDIIKTFIAVNAIGDNYWDDSIPDYRETVDVFRAPWPLSVFSPTNYFLIGARVRRDRWNKVRNRVRYDLSSYAFITGEPDWDNVRPEVLDLIAH